MEVCERFREFSDRKRCIVCFPNTHEGEEPEAYAIFLALMRVHMGIMILAPDSEERFEPVYRDALKYHLQTIRHSRLFTSYVPVKTRVYFVEIPEAQGSFYSCADFCIPGGTLVGGHVDLGSPIIAGCPMILGPRVPDNARWKSLLESGGAVHGKSHTEIVELAYEWLKNPEDAKVCARKAQEWWYGGGREISG